MEASSSTHGQAARYDSLSLSAAQSPDLRIWNRVGSRPRPIICNGGYSVTFYTPRGCYVNGRDTAWAAGTSQAAVHSKWSLAGAKYDDDIATYNGRYLIACTTTYGRVGDKVDFTLSDGTVIKCVIADAKNPNDQGCNKWGHSNGQNVIEFEVERSRFYRSGNPGSSSWKAEWGGKRVCSSVNSGSIL